MGARGLGRACYHLSQPQQPGLRWAAGVQDYLPFRSLCILHAFCHALCFECCELYGVAFALPLAPNLSSLRPVDPPGEYHSTSTRVQERTHRDAGGDQRELGTLGRACW